MAVFYTVFPVKGAPLLPGEVLFVMDPFPANVRLIMLRRRGQGYYAGYVEGDGAVVIRREGVQALVIRSVSEVSGCGQAVNAAVDTGD